MMSQKSLFGRVLLLAVVVSSIFFYGCGGGGKSQTDTLLDEYDAMVTEMEKAGAGAGSGSPAEMADKAMAQAKKMTDWTAKYQEAMKTVSADEAKKITERFNTINARMMKMSTGS